MTFSYYSFSSLSFYTYYKNKAFYVKGLAVEGLALSSKSRNYSDTSYVTEDSEALNASTHSDSCKAYVATNTAYVSSTFFVMSFVFLANFAVFSDSMSLSVVFVLILDSDSFVSANFYNSVYTAFYNVSYNIIFFVAVFFAFKLIDSFFFKDIYIYDKVSVDRICSTTVFVVVGHFLAFTFSYFFCFIGKN